MDNVKFFVSYSMYLGKLNTSYSPSGKKGYCYTVIRINKKIRKQSVTDLNASSLISLYGLV